MLVPEPGALTPLEHITPSIYEASIHCTAKAAWYALGGRSVLPENPAAMLGSAFHSVMAAAHRGELMVANEADRNPARRHFDESARALYLQAHPLIKLKFPTLERLPYYNVQRERAALLAARIASSRSWSAGPPVMTSNAAPRPLQTEFRLSSTDGLIVGRADHVDGESQTVVDYKSGYIGEADTDAVSDSEARQLRLYAYLAAENGVNVSKGAIVRRDGQRCELAISRADAEIEANSARRRLHEINAAIREGVRFDGLASPSSQSCRGCPCIALCDSFWAEANPVWQSDCGSHVEGCVSGAQTRQILGVSLTTLALGVQRGTVSGERLSAEQIPSDWMTLGSGSLPQAGDVIRVVYGRVFGAGEGAVVIRIDKTLTSVWRVPPEGEGGR